jgi:hypothetical protein
VIAVLDSATPPTRAQALAAKAAGVRGWNGYLASHPNVNLEHPWSEGDFAMLIEVFPDYAPIGYCSGLDDPAAIKALAAAWRIRPCLDDEGGIRPDGAWVGSWLQESGAGIYGNAPVHVGRTAPFHVLAGYPGYDPKATWSPYRPRPAGPCGWQWEGTHDEFGVSVDRCWFDDWFAQGEESMTLSPDIKRFHAFQMILTSWGRNPASEQELNDVADVIENDGSNLYEVAVSVWENPNGAAFRASQAAGSGKVPAHSHTGTVSVT